MRQSNLQIAAATVADVDALDAIERVSFATPWSRETFLAELARTWARIDTAWLDGRLVAFCNYWLVTTELHVLAIATQPELRGQGIARALLAHVLATGQAAGCTLATLEVRRSNAAAIALYERAGFTTVHVRAHYYADDEDALVMLADLDRRPV